MSSPADRYAAARRRSRGQLATFADSVGFELDPFQRDACEAVEAGHGVLVAAPTGAPVAGAAPVGAASAGAGRGSWVIPGPLGRRMTASLMGGAPGTRLQCESNG